MHFLDLVKSGTCPFLVGELTCQVDSGNERDLFVLFILSNDCCVLDT